MSKRMKTVVVIEDQERQREAITKTIGQFGFNAVSAATVVDTLELLKSHKGDAAVIVVDMKLDEFPDYKDHSSALTGISLAKKIRRENTDGHPEIIILSGVPDQIEYYRQAIEVGASAFLFKEEQSDRHKLVPSVQSLALKHSFQTNALNESEIAQLAEGHANTFELLEYFCHNKLTSELDLCLGGSRRLLLFQDKSSGADGRTPDQRFVSVYSDQNGFPGIDEFDYARMHEQIFKPLLPRGLYFPESSIIPGPKAEMLKEFIFIPLVNVAEAQIALGISNPFSNQVTLNLYPFSTESCGESLLKHASPALENYVQKLLFRLRERQSAKLERVKVSVGLSGSVQRRLSRVVREYELEAEESADMHDDLKQLSAELADYNRTLSTLLEIDEAKVPGTKGETIRLSDVVEEIKTEYARLGRLEDISFTVTADCLFPAQRYYFSLALRALVAWAFQRRTHMAGEENQHIQISCTIQGNWLELHFQENSERKSKRVRKTDLFEPMSPLQVAQLIIEVACHGKLVDVTDELQTQRGHLFKIKLLQN